MVDEDLELERDIGDATIVYEEPDAGVVTKNVPNEHIAYFQDHWILKTDEDDDGNDIIRRIPANRVHYVERSVDAFEEEVKTLVDQVQSFAADLRTKIPVPVGSSSQDHEQIRHIDVSDEAEDDTHLE